MRSASLALALLALACAPQGTGRAAASRVVRLGWAGSPDSLNPGVGILAESYTIFSLVYDALFQLELDNSFSLCLAESAERSADGRTWTFRVRRGSVWHDGTPVTAGDVRFSLEMYRDHAEFPFAHGYTTEFESLEAPDDRTVVLHLRHAIPNLESQLVFLYIVPEHIWAPWKDHPADFANREMVGSGPFRLVSWRPNEYLRLAANRAHPVTPPRVDEVLFVTYGSLDALAQAVRTGEVDAITEMPATAVPALRRVDGIHVVSGAPLTPRVADIKMNQHDPATCPPGGVCSGHPALRDLHVRRALARATPKREMLDVVLLGLGAPGLTLVADGLRTWFASDLADYPYDLAAAAAELESAGYRDRDGDGVREMPDGSRSLVFRLIFASDSPTAPRATELLVRSWAKIGVRAERRSVDPNVLAAARAPAFDYDVIFWGWDSDPDPSFLLSIMASEKLSEDSNDTGWSDAEYDDLFRRQAVALELDERRRLIHRMQEIALRDVVYIVPYYLHTAEAFRDDRFRGWKTDGPGLMLEDRSTLAVLEPLAPAE